MAVIVGAVRTPVGRFGGSLKDLQAYELAAVAIRGLLKKLGVKPVAGKEAIEFYPSRLPKGMIELEKMYHDYDGVEVPIDEVVFGNVLQAAQGQNPARQAAILAGIPKEVPAFTVNKVCASGMKALALAAQSVDAGDARFVIAGGTESMSNAPYALRKARWGYRMSINAVDEVIDVLVYDGLWEKFYGCHMGITAENVAELYGISREEQDRLAYESHMRAIRAIDEGKFREEIVPVEVGKRESAIVDTDEHPRRDTSLEKLSKLPPVFKEGGTVTAGNASGVNDGAAALLIADKNAAKEYGLEAKARIVAFASAGVDPAYMGLGPIPAVRKVLAKANVKLSDIGLVELNEAFAAQALACMKELNLDPEITNVNGSGISLGHPIGCTGARIVVTLIHEMHRRGVDYGLAALCVGGGMGMAMIVERV
ncbi:MAG: acetyl-CoA C-acetyltransferase [Archaeoglobaceae archaeon]